MSTESEDRLRRDQLISSARTPYENLPSPVGNVVTLFVRRLLKRKPNATQQEVSDLASNVAANKLSRLNNKKSHKNNP